MRSVNVSQNFKRSVRKAILSIVLFVFTYILLVALAVGLTIACGYGGIMLIALKPSFATLMLGIACISIGLLILFFMIKFVFSKNKTDRSHFIEIKQHEEPRLFAFIESIVNETRTEFPKKIYLSSEVNASVFYDSSFWSMFLPVKKNLHLGLGLMNSVTVDEFKGIVAHEFGHFSQRSMKVGSYVYNVNYILHNMLYDNDSYDAIISKWANASGYFSIAAIIGVRIIDAIQWVLKKIYEIVNLNYLALSREMEFHADEVAANVAGSKALATSLVRLDLASFAYNSTLEFYGNKIKDNKKPENIFPQMSYILSFWGNELKLATINNLPAATLDSKSRFNKSKLGFDDQWSSHPSDKDRINKLENLNIPAKNQNTEIAVSLFENPLKKQEIITAMLFSKIEYSNHTTRHTLTEFKSEFSETISKSTFAKKYNNYFDDLTITALDFDTPVSLYTSEEQEKEMFSQEAVDLIYQTIGLRNDIETLNKIASGDFEVKSFDYEGNRYKSSDASTLLSKIEEELKKANLQVEENNKKIFAYYYNIAKNNNKEHLYTDKYNKYLNYINSFETKSEVLKRMYNTLSFTQQNCSFEKINSKMKKVYREEVQFKTIIKELLENSEESKILAEEHKEVFTKYTSTDLNYFSNERYNEGSLNLLFSSINFYNVAMNDIQFMYKKDFLDFQASLTESALSLTNNIQKELLN